MIEPFQEVVVFWEPFVGLVHRENKVVSTNAEFFGISG